VEKGGAQRQAIGLSRGGRNTKLHAPCDGSGRPLAFRLTGGNAADAPQAIALLEQVPEDAIVLADTAYDADAIRRFIESRKAVPNIPFKTNRRWKGCFSPFLYRGRNAIERMFCRLKVFRRVTTRYDKLAANFLAAVQIAALIAYWV
jgi:transposase